MVFLLLAETAAYLSVTTSTKVRHRVALGRLARARRRPVLQVVVDRSDHTQQMHIYFNITLSAPPSLRPFALTSPPVTVAHPSTNARRHHRHLPPPSCAHSSQYRFLATLPPCEHCTPDRTGLAPCPGCRLLIGVSGWRARSPIPSVCGIRPGGATRSAFASGWAVPVWPAQHPRAGRRGRPRVSCEYASLDVHDVLGHHRVNVTKNVGKYSVDSDLKWTGRVVRAAGRLSFLLDC